MEKYTLNEAIEIYKAFNKSFYWLNEMVKQGLINKAAAGYIISLEG
jgi:hypothetical protein